MLVTLLPNCQPDHSADGTNDQQYQQNWPGRGRQEHKEQNEGQRAHEEQQEQEHGLRTAPFVDIWAACSRARYGLKRQRSNE